MTDALVRHGFLYREPVSARQKQPRYLTQGQELSQVEPLQIAGDESLTARPMLPEDEPAVSRVLAACEDYFLAATGSPALAADVQSLYYSLPDGADFEQKHLLVLCDGAEVVGVVDAVAGCPDARSCSVGLFLLTPEARRKAWARWWPGTCSGRPRPGDCDGRPPPVRKAGRPAWRSLRNWTSRCTHRDRRPPRRRVTGVVPPPRGTCAPPYGGPALP